VSELKDQAVTLGPLRRVVVLKHGDHIGQQGTPEGGSEAGYTHVPGSVPGSGDEEPETTGLPPSMAAEDVGDRLFFHGTLVDHLESIEEHGLLPQVGNWVSDVYLENERPVWAPEAAPPESLIYLAGPQEIYIDPEHIESGDMPDEAQVGYQGDNHAMIAITAAMAHSKIASGEDWRWSEAAKGHFWPEWEQLRRDGLVVIVDGQDVRDAEIQYMDGSNVYPVEVGLDSVSVDPTLGVPMNQLGPERSDFITSSVIRPRGYLYGDQLMKYIAQWILDHKMGGPRESDDHENATTRAEEWFQRYEEDIYQELSLFEEEEDLEEESMHRQLPPPTPRRIFVPLSILFRHFGPGPHPGTGTPQEVHAGDGAVGGDESGDSPSADPGRGPDEFGRVADGLATTIRSLDDLLYQAEKASIAMAGALTDQAAAQAFVDKIINSVWWKARSSVGPVEVRYQPSGWAEAHQTGPKTGLIVIPPARLNKAFICH